MSNSRKVAPQVDFGAENPLGSRLRPSKKLSSDAQVSLTDVLAHGTCAPRPNEHSCDTFNLNSSQLVERLLDKAIEAENGEEEPFPSDFMTSHGCASNKVPMTNLNSSTTILASKKTSPLASHSSSEMSVSVQEKNECDLEPSLTRQESGKMLSWSRSRQYRSSLQEELIAKVGSQDEQDVDESHGYISEDADSEDGDGGSVGSHETEDGGVIAIGLPASNLIAATPTMSDSSALKQPPPPRTEEEAVQRRISQVVAE